MTTPALSFDIGIQTHSVNAQRRAGPRWVRKQAAKEKASTAKAMRNAGGFTPDRARRCVVRLTRFLRGQPMGATSLAIALQHVRSVVTRELGIPDGPSPGIHFQYAQKKRPQEGHGVRVEIFSEDPTE